MKKTDKNMGKTKRKTLPHLTNLLVIAAVVVTALLTPQVLFYIQDRIQWGKMELGQREGLDVEALSSTYENSLYQRMLNYAEGLSAGDTFYSTSKNLTVNENLQDYLYSERGLYQSIIDFLFNWGVIPWLFLDQSCEVKQWKQYVIYSDNYTEGVNFILWYIELSSMDEARLKLLADAENGTLYALKLENCPWTEESYRVYTFSGYENRLSEEAMLELWGICSMYFEAFSSEEELLRYIQEGVGETQEASPEIVISQQERQFEEDIYMDADGLSQKYEILLEDAIIDFIMSKIQVRTEMGGENSISFQLPYGRYSLDIEMKSRSRQENVTDDISGRYYMYPDTTIGLRQIYEMIPEFSDK